MEFNRLWIHFEQISIINGFKNTNGQRKRYNHQTEIRDTKVLWKQSRRKIQIPIKNMACVCVCVCVCYAIYKVIELSPHFICHYCSLLCYLKYWKLYRNKNLGHFYTKMYALFTHKRRATVSSINELDLLNSIEKCNYRQYWKYSIEVRVATFQCHICFNGWRWKNSLGN